MVTKKSSQPLQVGDKVKILHSVNWRGRNVPFLYLSLKSSSQIHRTAESGRENYLIYPSCALSWALLNWPELLAPTPGY
jgi:hypothetical protein